MNQTRLFLKWMDGRHPHAHGVDLTFVNKCVVAAFDENERVAGFTVFEPRDLTEAVFARLDRRMHRADFADHHFVLFAPAFFQHRVQSLGQTRPDLRVEYTGFVALKHRESTFSLRSRLRVVNVDDSPVLLKFLKHTLDRMGYVDVVAQISDAETAAEKIQKLKPDVVTMDIQMPGKTGVDVVKDLLAAKYFPVLMISSLSLQEGSLVFSALNAGAFDYIQKPKLEERDVFAAELQKKMLLSIEGQGAHAALRKTAGVKAPVTTVTFSDQLIWCLGASTGGTQALTSVFTSLPTHIPPTLVVQHIPAVFSRSFAESLNLLCPFTVKEAEDGEPVLNDHVYIAAGGLQMGVERRHGKLYLRLLDAPPVNRFKPSVDFMFDQVAKIDGLNVVAGVLTGMGKDGAKGLLGLKNTGAQTFAQDEASSAVYGMPRECVEIGATATVRSLDMIAQTLLLQSQAFRKAS